jgi:hypothetical protein
MFRSKLGEIPLSIEMGLHDEGKRVGGVAGETKGGVEDVFDAGTNGCINGVLLYL